MSYKWVGEQVKDGITRGLRAYREVLRLVRRLPPETRPYYAAYARENFGNYRHAGKALEFWWGRWGGWDEEPAELEETLRRAYDETIWVLDKYSVDRMYASKLRAIMRNKIKLPKQEKPSKYRY